MKQFDTSWLKSRRNQIIVIAIGVAGLVLFTLACVGVYVFMKNRSRSQAALQAELPPAPTATSTLPAAYLPLVPIPTETLELAQPTPVSQAPTSQPVTGQAANSLWRFVKFNLKDVALFESVDNPGQMLKARCQQPNLPRPQAGRLYRLDESGILIPANGSTNVQRFAVKQR
ncbi:MAG: hypothetical protein AB1894_19465 [Chloroflexota bacterium]